MITNLNKFPYQTQIIRSFAEATSIREDWNRLAADHFMLQWDWLGNWWHVFSQGDRGQSTQKLVLLAVRDQAGSVVAIAPMYREKSLSGISLRFLADRKACSDYVRILAEPQHVEAVNQHLATWIASREFRSEFGDIDWVEIDGYLGTDQGWAAFWNELSRHGWSPKTKHIESAWFTELPTEWNRFQTELSKSRIRKTKKAFKLRDSGCIQFDVLETPAEIQANWNHFVLLHQRRREQQNQVGCFANPRFEQFLLKATLDFAADQKALLMRVSETGKAFGYLLLFRNISQLAMYQSGFDPDFEHREPGHLINTYTLQYAMENGISQFDFLRGDEQYKSGWNAQCKPLLHTRSTSPKLSSRLKNSVWNAGRSLKNWRNSAITITPEQESAVHVES